MTERMTEFSGTDIGAEKILYQDTLDTWRRILKETICGQAEIAYKVLQANNVFSNTDNFAAEEFVDSNGQNNTINTGSSTMNYNSSDTVYRLGGTAGTTETSSSISPTTNDTPSISTTLSIADTGYFSTYIFGAETSGSYTLTVKKNGTTIASKSGSHSSGSNTVNFNPSDYSALLESGDTCVIDLTGTQLGVQTGQTYSGTKFSYSSQSVPARETTVSITPFEWTSYTFDSSSTLIADSNMPSLDGTETGIGGYVDADFPTNTSMTVTVSDGTTSLSAVSVDTVTKYWYVSDISSLSSGNVKLTYTGSTTDNAVTLDFRGGSMRLIRN